MSVCFPEVLTHMVGTDLSSWHVLNPRQSCAAMYVSLYFVCMIKQGYHLKCYDLRRMPIRSWKKLCSKVSFVCTTCRAPQCLTYAFSQLCVARWPRHRYETWITSRSTSRTALSVHEECLVSWKRYCFRKTKNELEDAGLNSVARALASRQPHTGWVHAKSKRGVWTHARLIPTWIKDAVMQTHLFCAKHIYHKI